MIRADIELLLRRNCRNVISIICDGYYKLTKIPKKIGSLSIFHTLIYGLKPARKRLERCVQIDLEKFFQYKCRRI